MAMTLFGAKIEVPRSIESGTTSYLLAQVAERSEERKILGDFLSDQRLLELDTKTRKAAKEKIDSQEFDRNELAVFYTREMKRSRLPSGISLYHELIYRLLEEENDGYRQYIGLLRKGEIDVCDLPQDFPTLFKRAESVLGGKLRSELGEKEQLEYLARKELVTELRVIAQDLFFGINHNLAGEQLMNFMCLMYELRRLQTADCTNKIALRKNIVRSLREGCQLTLIHIKCLRFTYPYGDRLALVDHLDDVKVPTKNGDVHRPLSERKIFDRLDKLVALFRSCGISARLLILLSDQDLSDYFPHGGSGMVPDADVKEARNSLARYRKSIEKVVGRDKVSYLREHLKRMEKLEEFDARREIVMAELNLNKSIFSGSFIENRVNYRYESNRRIFRTVPCRSIARDRVYAQLASMQALGVLGKDVGDNTNNIILVEEDRGDENKFIGGCRKTALPVFFMELRKALV